MSTTDPAYAAYLEKEYAAEARKAQEILVANQLAQFKTGSSATQRAAAPQADQYLILPERELPSTAPELRHELKESIASYHKAIEHAKSFEAKLREARKAEADALTDDAADEKKVAKTVAENLGLQQVYSRRAELAKQKVPEAFVAILPIAKALAQDLVNRCVRLAHERANAHREVFEPRLDQETFIRTFPSGFPVDFESSLDRVINCCSDVINARACIPQFSFLGRSAMPADLTFEQLQRDLDALERAEAAYQAEAAREYDFGESEVMAAAN